MANSGEVAAQLRNAIERQDDFAIAAIVAAHGSLILAALDAAASIDRHIETWRNGAHGQIGTAAP